MEQHENIEQQIAELRNRIDDIDCEIVKLLNERAKIALAIRDLKPRVSRPLFDPKREEEIFGHLARCNEGPMYPDHLREIYEAILHVMKELQK